MRENEDKPEIDREAHGFSAEGAAGSGPPPEGLRRKAPEDPTWKTVCLNLAVAYAVAIIFTVYFSAPNDLAALMIDPLLLVAVSGIFGFAVVAVIRLRKPLARLFKPKAVWLASTWLALFLSLVDPFLPAPSTLEQRGQEPATELVKPSGIADRGTRTF